MQTININNNPFENLKNFNFGGLKKVLVILGLVFFVLLPLLSSFNPFIKVEYGTVGIVDRFGKLNRKIDPGLHIKIPIVENVKFFNTQKLIYQTEQQPAQSKFNQNISLQKEGLRTSNAVKNFSDVADFPVDTSTKDGQQVSIMYTLRYSLDPAKILEMAQKIGSGEQIIERIVKSQSRSVARNIARQFPANELYTGDVFTYQTSVENKLKESFTQNGVILDEFLVRQIKFDENYIDAIEQKQIANEQVKTEEFKAKQEEFKKQQAIIKAEGQARSQEILKQSLNAQILEKLAIEKWDGKLPVYSGGNGAVPFIDLQK